MHISKIHIRNIMGIEELDFDAGQFNVISAANGRGKTSVLEALKSLIRRTEDATLLRKGAQTGEVVLVLDDGTEISRKLSDRNTKPNVTIRSSDGVKVPQPASVMDALADIIATNPIEFVHARKKDRVDVLLETLPITIDAERLAQIVGHEAELKPGAAPFDQLDSLRQEIYDERTGTNRALTEKRHTIEQLSQTLPTATDNTPQDQTGLLAEVNEIDAKRDAELKRIGDKIGTFREALDKATAELREEAEGDMAALQEEMRELERKIASRRMQLSDAIQVEKDQFAQWEAKAAQQKQTTLDRHAAARKDVEFQLERIRSRDEQATRHKQVRETIDRLEIDANSLKSDSDRQSAAIDGIDNYKNELLDSLPVPGLEVRGGEIYRHGIQFDRLNTAQQVEIAVEIAKLRAGRLKVVCVDGIEMLDAEHFAAFREQMRAAGLQAIVTRVSDHQELSLEAA